MKLADLKEPRKVAACACCKAFIADVDAPIGETSAPMCWLCAHHVVDHDVPVHEAAEATCKCKREDIYPVRVLRAREALLESSARLVRY